MKNKFRVIISFVFILISTVAYSQLKYEFNFDKNKKILSWKMSNETSEILYLRHPMESGDFGKSYFMAEFFDYNNRTIFKTPSQFTSKMMEMFEPGATKTHSYNLVEFAKEYKIENICYFKIYGTVMTVSPDKPSHRSFFEETYQWD